MSAAQSAPNTTALAVQDLLQDYLAVRQRSLDLVAPLSAEDCAIQSMADASPSKWHLAHSSWFFETFLLQAHQPGYTVFDPAFAYLFNSYYESVGPRHARPQRGLLSRPSLQRVLEYRQAVDAAVVQGLQSGALQAQAPLLRLGLAHEQQHQELLLTDIKHALAQNPLQEAYDDRSGQPEPGGEGEGLPALGWLSRPEGFAELGHGAEAGFAFDNESPRHRVWLPAYALADRPVTQAEWLAFMADGAYENAALWLSDGWAWVQSEDIRAPLYWYQEDGRWWQYTLQGPCPVDPSRPVAHLSFYEAAAYAEWAGARLPTEQEWEALAAERPLVGDFCAASPAEALPLGEGHPGHRSAYFYGGVWEWTRSAYGPYPGFRPPAGALGEYNAKFMASQLVLRGGSCASPPGHLRPSYRNFFYPQQRWQFSGLRLARDD